MKKWTLFLVFTLLLGYPIVCSADELGGGYSINPPEGWAVSDFPGSPYKGLYGAREGNFTPNINIQDENYNGSLDKYIELNMEHLKKLLKAEKLKQAPFSAQNHEGVKLVTQTEINDFELTQTFYFFEKPTGKKVVVTATTQRGSGRRYDPVFDDIMSSFQMD